MKKLQYTLHQGTIRFMNTLSKYARVPRGREALKSQIADVERVLGTAALLGATSEESGYLTPRPLRPGRTLQGDWIGTPYHGIRAYSSAMLDAVILFALRKDQNEPMGVHVEPTGATGDRQMTLMAASPADLPRRTGFVAVVSPQTFESDDPGDGGEPWAFIDATSNGVAILARAFVTSADLAETVFQVDDPELAFYEHPDPRQSLNN